jgi:hypothetical protein
MSRSVLAGAAPDVLEPPELDPDDYLRNGNEIHQFIIQYRPQAKSTTFKQLAKGVIPAGRDGRNYHGSKKGIRRRLAEGTGL